jgi:hypothetical protein
MGLVLNTESILERARNSQPFAYALVKERFAEGDPNLTDYLGVAG